MPMTIALPFDTEQLLQAEAALRRMPVEEVAARHVQEAQLLRRIFTYLPASETREMRSLVRKRQAGQIDAAGAERLQELAYHREQQNADRLADLLALAQLRGVTLQQVMTELGIRPARVS